MPLVNIADAVTVKDNELVLDSSEDCHLNSDLNNDQEVIDEEEIAIESIAENRCNIQQFDVLKTLGKGAFGEVFLVRRNCGADKEKKLLILWNYFKQGTLYAMKMLRKATLKIRDRLRTRTERNILVEIEHPFIVKLKYAFQTSGKLYLIMDFLRGGDLFSRLNGDVMFTEEDAKFYLAEVASALLHLHSLGIIYRDLKPENILLDVEGHIVLTDFGLSKIPLNNIINSQYLSVATYDENAFSFCGTIEYMAPEIINGGGHSYTADWWSFGVLMYEMLTGQLPFEGQNQQHIMEQILKVKLPMPTYFSPSAKLLIRQLFKRNPMSRLGHGSQTESSKSIKEHVFFQNINWSELLEKKIRPPFKPFVSPEDDAFYIDRQLPILYDSPGVPVSANSYELFRGFSYVETTPLRDYNQYSNSSLPNRKDLNSTIPQRFGIFNDEYDIVSNLGKGTFANCYECQQKSTNNRYAVKIIQKNQSMYMSEEIEILLRFGNHPGIVQLYFVYENSENLYLVMELLKGGELIQYILEKKSLNEPETAAIFKTILEVIVYLHGHNVVHRDLKPSNILFATKERRPNNVKICDMGFAKQLRAENGLLMTPCYTANYAAPEILKQQGYHSACDIWSLGVILYMMLSGQTPFTFHPSDSADILLSRISKGNINFQHPNWCHLSNDVRNLILNMLNINPDCRPKAHHLLSNEWLTKNCHAYHYKSCGSEINLNVKQQSKTILVPQPFSLPQPLSLPQSQPLTSNKVDENYKKLRREVDATFKALTKSPHVAPLGPINMSSLAKRRFDRNQSIS